MENLFLLVLSMLDVESADSIHMLYKHFLSKVTEKSLNAFYYACSYAKIDCSQFMNVTARLALQIIPEHLRNEPVFLCIDDTMIAKFGKKFEDVSLSTEKIGDYYVGVRKVLTNIFGDRCVHAYVTASNKTTETRILFSAQSHRKLFV